MEHFVTLFDAGFLPQGLALYQSLERHCPSFRLWVVCIDRKTFEVLGDMALEHLQPIALETIITPGLEAARAERSRAEFCWTLTPFSPRFVFDIDPGIQRVTYVDADVWFMRDPKTIFEEFDRSGKSVLITGHGFLPEYDISNRTGRFCVQFMTFNRDAGEKVRSWWAERCLEWCYARMEAGKFGDQKYLDDFERLFPDAVHALRDEHLLLAPWNAARFPHGPAILYHFHGLRLLTRGKVLLARGYHLPGTVIKAVYAPYLEDLAAAIARLSSVGYAAGAQAEAPGIVDTLGILFRKMQRAWGKLLPFRIATLPHNSVNV